MQAMSAFVMFIEQKVVPLYTSYHLKTMFLIDSIKTFGRYLILMRQVLKRPERWRMYFRRTLHEIYQLGVNSIPIVLVISLFIGAVLCIQMKTNVESPWMPKFVTGYATREVLLLEFSSTIMCLILAGKVGSNITSEIGAMRVTQQIDALDMMGVNSAGFLVLPKLVATTLLGPLLVLFSLCLGLVGGWIVVEFTQIIPTQSYITGIKAFYNGYYVFYSCFKMSLFCFMISSIAAFNGYYAKGGSLGVGRSSTTAIVVTSILILLSDLVVTQLMLY